MSEAVSYLVNLEIRPAKKLPRFVEQKRFGSLRTLINPQQEVISIDDTAIDVVTYEYKKRLFDQLAELLLKAENLRGNIHLMGRPGARSVMLSAEKQVLYENMDDCVNGAVTGLNIAVYNLRSACRIGSRTDFCKW